MFTPTIIPGPPPALNERVDVCAAFPARGRKIQPLSFTWASEKRTVSRVTYTWKSIRGETVLLHFAVTDDVSLYELVYNTTSLTWHLSGVQSLDELPDPDAFLNPSCS